LYPEVLHHPNLFVHITAIIYLLHEISSNSGGGGDKNSSM
jgi:hypothetical protein